MVVAHPVAVLTTVGIAATWAIQLAFLLAGQDLMPAKLAELLVLLALAVSITRMTDGRSGVAQLFRGLRRWRLGARYLVLVGAVPVLTLLVAMATGTLDPATGGWAGVALTYALLLVLGAVTANLWEETVWGGFVQGRLMARHGLLLGSLLTAIPVFLVHLPLAFENHGLAGTTWPDVLVTWAVLLVAAPFQRYLVGALLVDTGGSTFAAGLMHASVNAAGAMVVVSAGWQSVPALALLTVAYGVWRARRGASPTAGCSPELVPASMRPTVSSDRPT